LAKLDSKLWKHEFGKRKGSTHQLESNPHQKATKQSIRETGRD